MKEISLTQGKLALVDDKDFIELSKHKWCAVKTKNSERWYAHSKVCGKMHRFLLGNPPQMVDHKDGDGLNNTRGNLRVCSDTQNNMNKRKSEGCSSRFKGVIWERLRNRWRSEIMLDRKRISLGRFEFETEAALAYDRAALKQFKEFARLNFPRGKASPERPTFLFVGHGRSGKDTCAEMFSAITKLRYAGSFSWHAIPFMADFLKVHPMTAWSTRHDRRQLWKDRLDYLRGGDETLLAELALATGEISAGLRDKAEIEAVKAAKLFTRIFWVERPGTPVDPTTTFGPEDCDEVIYNDAGLVHLHSKLFLIAERLGLVPDLYLSGKVRVTTDRFRD